MGGVLFSPFLLLFTISLYSSIKVVVARIPRKKIKLMIKVKLRTVALNLLFYLAEHVIKATIFILSKSYGTHKRGKTNT